MNSADSGGSLAFNRGPSRSSLRPQTRRAPLPRRGALEALGRFCDLYETGELPEYHDIVDTIIAWSDEILAWHHSDRASNGRIEGTNNLLQVLRRSAHGFTNPTNFEARGILVT